jgi:demethylmenaquinone methyltransferase/2-methoxy-6-polyprenyl-1,4-benzoquinol methylase/phosphoethanolamine N-methyltransferase
MTAPQTKGKVIRWARWYDLGSKLLSFGRDKAIRTKALELAAIRPGEKVLDVGCGTGTLAIAASDLTGEAGEVHGVDPSPEMIEVAQRKAAGSGRHVRFQMGVIEALPYPDNEFDLVLSSLMLHHLPDDLKQKGFAEVVRVLKPGGRFLAVDFGSDTKSFLGHLLAVLGHARGSSNAETLAAALGDSGFGDVETGSTGIDAIWFFRAQVPGR